VVDFGLWWGLVCGGLEAVVPLRMSGATPTDSDHHLGRVINPPVPLQDEITGRSSSKQAILIAFGHWNRAMVPADGLRVLLDQRSCHCYIEFAVHMSAKCLLQLARSVSTYRHDVMPSPSSSNLWFADCGYSDRQLPAISRKTAGSPSRADRSACMVNLGWLHSSYGDAI
jgi:hypothetical protein